jgi:ABC-2 type transport system permease protein
MASDRLGLGGPGCAVGYRERFGPEMQGPRRDVSTVHSSQTGWARYGPLIDNFAGRELRSRYRTSFLGWAWSLINPLVTIGVYALVFGGFFGVQAPRAGSGDLQNFALYLFAGLVVWNIFAAMVSGPMVWLLGVGDMLKKVSFPADAALLGGAVAAAVQTLIEASLLIVIMLLVGNSGWSMVLLPLVLLQAALLGLGVGLALSIANVYLRDVAYLVGVALQILFFLTPIIYVIDIIPEEVYGLPAQDLLALNPLTHLVADARDAVYFLDWPDALGVAVMTVTSAGVFLIGWVLFRRWSVGISEEL